MQKSSFLAYKITDPAFYSQNPTRFFLQLRKSRPSHIVTLRDKQNLKLQKLAKRFVRLKGCVCLNQDFLLAKRLGFGCVHFTGSQLELARRARRAGFFTIYSAHSFQELKMARRYRIDLVTYSPVFATPGKDQPLGLAKLRKAARKYKNIIALGGIVGRAHIRSVRKSGARGFASIRYFISTLTGR